MNPQLSLELTENYREFKYLGSGIDIQAYEIPPEMTQSEVTRVLLKVIRPGFGDRDFMVDIAHKSIYLPKIERITDGFYVMDRYEHYGRFPTSGNLQKQFDFLDRLWDRTKPVLGVRFPRNRREVDELLRRTPTSFTRLKYAVRMLLYSASEYFDLRECFWDISKGNLSISHSGNHLILRDLFARDEDSYKEMSSNYNSFGCFCTACRLTEGLL